MDDTERSAAVRAVTIERFGDDLIGLDKVLAERRGAIDALKTLATFYEDNPGIPVPRHVLASHTVPADMLGVIAAHLGADVHPDGHVFYDLSPFQSQATWVRLAFSPPAEGTK